MTDPARCEVCGADVDDYGCMGRFTGRHAEAEVQWLKSKLRKLLGLWADRATRLAPDDPDDPDEFSRGVALAYWTCASEVREECGV